jgi:hypothetical protein
LRGTGSGSGDGRPRPRFLFRDFEAGGYLDFFLVAAVTTVLAIRFFLRLAGYPRVETGSLHVAHMLWGGLLMLAALVILLSYIGRGVHQVAALLGGVGFGAFIDELGKFITKDNDYFYKPTVALIYAVFVLLYLAFRSIHREQLATREEFLVNALQEMEFTAARGFTRSERNRVLSYLSRSDPADPLVRTMLEIVAASPAPDVEKLSPFRVLKEKIVRVYRKMAVTRSFQTAVVTFFVAQLGLKIALAVAQVFAGGMDKSFFYLPVLSTLDTGIRGHSLADWAQLFSSFLSGVFVALGVFWIRRSRLRAFRMFQRSILVSIFLTQVFLFYRDEFSALIGLAFHLLVFLALRFMITREMTRPGRAGTSAVEAAASS